MNDPETPPTDDPLAALLGAAAKDAPAPDSAFLARLREESLAAFESASAASTTPAPPSPRKRTMPPISFRWLAAGVAAVLVLGIVIAQWLGSRKEPAPDPAPDEKFVFEGTLVDDGRIGKVTDAQGVVAVKPVMAERWSPVQPRLVLKPGDWLRTDARGANAVALKLLKSAAVIVGPHSQVELVKADEIRLLSGEIEINAGDTPVELHGPDKQKLSVKGKQIFRIEKEKLVRVEQEPKWLLGFRGTTASESLGSLVAKVDGRDVPLTVGYHHVTVDIRDQIARTTIEESFVNTTPGVLEGVFYFPLPQDASISGFGMWIGDALVEADVVEKQRAREIYETILHEKRDPGLLEWAGGNLFKARVFPIPGRGEKRIKITYTQVLPLQGNRYRYSYGLQSELLKQHPLRDLKIDVKVNSAVSLKAVSSPTHPARVAKTEHSGYVEFAAREYTPTRDFEAVFEVEPGRPDVVVVPHRRGDDGYFMVQLTPPGAAGDWERPLVPTGEPLKLLVLADTSASMDRGQRGTQTAVLSSLLGSLTPKDTINVAACDVNCDWVFEKPVAATPENVAAVMDFLANRQSLGWTDLDKAFSSALSASAAGTHVVYLGDGITTTGTADPVAFAKRLQRLYEGKSGTFHAVALGSTFEPGALKAIAALGSGSMRRVSSDRGPQATALELLTEIAAPGLRDLKVEFVGFRTARVYPDTLPNVPAGTQQILLGRYLPEGKDQSGEIVVTGTLGGKPVRYTSKVSLKDAEQGNSFVPRLWARMHLDKLLEQGTTPEVKQDVIALSEEFHIITPYTSLLVLETDADRERFAVKRRFQMRDGEKFFAQGRDNANFELKQRQMRLAGDYRTTVRRQVLANLNTLGRDVRMFRAQRRYDVAARLSDLTNEDVGFDYFFDDLTRDGKAIAYDFAAYDIGALGDRLDGGERLEKALGESSIEGDWRGVDGGEPEQWFGADSNKMRSYMGRESVYIEQMTSAEWDGDGLAVNFSTGKPWGGEEGYFGRSSMMAESALPYYRGRARGRYRGPQLQWFGALVPAVGGPAREPKAPKKPWPAAALALSRSLLRTDKLAQVRGGVVVLRQSDSFDRRTGELFSREARLELVSPAAWLTRSAPDGGQVLVHWCDAKECGAYSTAFQLGRVRASNVFDPKRPPLGLNDDSVNPLHVAYAHWAPTIEVLGKERELLILKHADSPEYEVRVLIDTTRHVVLSVEHRNKGKVTSQTKFGDFVEVGGTWWARRVEAFDDQERRVSLVTQTVNELPADEFTKRMAQELAGRGKVLFLRQPLPSVSEAKAALAANKATFDDRAVLTLYFAATQQWARAGEHLRECEKLAAGKSGMRWLADAFLLAARRHDELRKRILDETTALAATTDADTRANDHFLAEYLLGQSQQVSPANEQLTLSDALQKVYERQQPHVDAAKAWRTRRVNLFERAGQPDKTQQLAKELATEFPRDHSRQYHYATMLARSGDYPAAYAWLDRVLGPGAKWDADQENEFRGLYSDLLRQQGRHRDLAEYLGVWVKRNPESQQPYAQYLTALIWSNQSARAEELVARWLREGQIEGELPYPVAARLGAAVSFATGQGYDLYTNRVEERWHAPLAEAVLHFARRAVHAGHASNILQSSRFSNTEAARGVRKALAELLQKEIDTLAPDHIDYLVHWVWSGTVMERADWLKTVAALRTRWDAEKNPEAKHRLGQPLGRVLSWIGSDEHLAFLRVQWKTGPEPYRVSYANELFSTLLGQKWTAEIEDEAFGLLDKLADLDEPGALFVRIAALHRLTDAMLQARFVARENAIERPEKLTRTELQKKLSEAQKAARVGFSDRLRKEAARHAKPFASWITAERVWIDVPLDRDLKSAADDCWAVVTAAPIKANPDDDATVVAARLDEALRARAFVTLLNLAARKGADAALVDRVLKFVDQQMKDHPDDPRWRSEKYRLLVALDRVKDLEAELAKWVAGADSDNRWRLALGYLLAEQGNVPDAIKQLEAVEKADELTPVAYRSLAAWYMVENRRADHEKARAAAYRTTDEQHLSQRLNLYLSPWQRTSGHLPTKLDPEVLTIFAVLFEKSATPQNYLSSLQQFYLASRAPELLSMLPDGAVGHTAGKVYPFLRGMRSVLDEVRDEATVDTIVTRIGEVRKTAKTPVDQRALDLLELLVERRAAELQNQPGPHAEKALAALERAFKREWAAGEPRLLADFLEGLGRIPQPTIAKEQLRQLESLHRAAAPGSFDRLYIALRYAETLDNYARKADATDLLQSALKEFEDANKGVLPTSANDALGRLVYFAESAGYFDRAEKLLLAQLKHPVHAEQKNWLAHRLNELYLRALRDKGEVSLGTSLVLYKALERKFLAGIAGAEQYPRFQLFNHLARLYREAHALSFAGVAFDLREFAFKTLPPILKEQYVRYDAVVLEVSEALYHIAGPRDAIAFVLDRVDDEPDRLRYANQDAWNRHGGQLASWRANVKDLGALEPRLLKLVLAELRRDLRTGEARERRMYDRRRDYYWPEKEAEFAKVAEEVLAGRKASSAAVESIAEYLFSGLQHQKRAIEILFTAHEAKVLSESGRWQLIDYLHRTQRFAESVPLLLPLVETRPDNLGYRTKLMHAYFRTGKQAELLALLKQTDAHFHEKDRWTEGVLAALAESCLENRLFAQAVAYYEELIPRRERDHPRGGGADGTLSNYYAHAARAYAGLGNTKKAVEMASGAIVSWGPNQEQRKHALAALVQVLFDAPDLAAYVVELNKEKLQSAIVRKAIGQAYMQKNDHARAIVQLNIAADLQPDDAEIYTALLACHDKIGDQGAAVRELHRAVELSRRDIKLFEQLGRRYADLNQPHEAERAFTSIVEALPNESESHTLLAEVREKQKRWPEAIAHWERVAEIRVLEPTGLVRLAAAQVESGDRAGAARTVQKLRGQVWPPRFNDLPNQLRDLERKLEERQKQ